MYVLYSDDFTPMVLSDIDTDNNNDIFTSSSVLSEAECLVYNIRQVESELKNLEKKLIELFKKKGELS